jgi:hypothetical protein
MVPNLLEQILDLIEDKNYSSITLIMAKESWVELTKIDGVRDVLDINTSDVLIKAGYFGIIHGVTIVVIHNNGEKGFLFLDAEETGMVFPSHPIYDTIAEYKVAEVIES